MVGYSSPRVSRHFSMACLPVPSDAESLNADGAKMISRSVSCPALGMPEKIGAESQVGKSAIPPAPPLPDWFHSIPPAPPLPTWFEPRVAVPTDTEGSQVSVFAQWLFARSDDPMQTGSVHSDTDSQEWQDERYTSGIFARASCSICYEDVKRAGDLQPIYCCYQATCAECMQNYVRGKVSDGDVRITCPASSCTTRIPEGDVRSYLDRSEWDRYERLLIIKDSSGDVHLCPNCSHITHAPANRHRKQGTSVVCPECSFNWCFECEGRWHAKTTCRLSNKHGSKDFRAWLKTRVRDTPNAQRCPKCKIPIQRSSGCNNMTCSKCHTSFCYRCGGRQHDLFLLGDHHSRLSVLGCKYNFKPNKPVQRKAIRGSLLFAGVTLGVPLCIGGGVVLLAGVLAVSPFYGTYKIVKNAMDRY